MKEKERNREKNRERERKREKNVQDQLLSICIQFSKRKRKIYWQKYLKSQKVSAGADLYMLE